MRTMIACGIGGAVFLWSSICGLYAAWGEPGAWLRFGGGIFCALLLFAATETLGMLDDIRSSLRVRDD